MDSTAMWQRLLAPAIWLAAGALLVRLLWTWRTLPERVAVHFNLERQADAWVSRRAFGTIMAAVLLMLTGLGFALRITIAQPAAPMFPAVIMAITAGMLVAVFWQVIRFNETSRPIHVAWFVAPAVVIVALVLFVLLR
jgi:hypothetical protein